MTLRFAPGFGLAQDVRFGVRRLRKTPLFTAAVLVTLSAAIAANVAAFSAVRAILLRPLPIRQPDRVVLVQETGAGAGQAIAEVSHRNFVDWRAQSRSFDGMAAIGSTNWSIVIDRDGQPIRVKTAAVSASFFDLLGATPGLGRTLLPADDTRGAAGVLVLSDRLWRTVFGADPHAIGTQVATADRSFTIVGVMPPAFAYPAGADAWTAVVPTLEASNARWKVDTLELRSFGMLNVVGRLKAGVSPEQARADLDVIVRRLPEADPKRFGESAVLVTPLLDHIFGPTRRGLLLLFGMVCFVLLIACANVSSLVLARAAGLRQVFAIKAALGASRGQIVREWVVEMAIVTAAAGVIGIFLAWIGLQPLLAMAPSSLPHVADVHIDRPVLLFALGLCVLTMMLCAVLPAIQASARGARDARVHMRSGSGGGPRPLIGRGLLTAVQIACATVLLTGAGLLVRSFDQLRRIDPGFEARHVLTLGVEPQAPNKAAYRAAYDAILARVATLPAVEAVGAVSQRPLASGHVGTDSGYLLEGQRLFGPEAKNNVMLNFEAVTPGYFDAMRITLHRGRLFTPRDAPNAPAVAIVSESTARQLWPGQDPIGKRLSIASGNTEDGKFPMETVVGVVSDVRYRGLDDNRFDAYMPWTQTQTHVGHLMIRTSGDPTLVARSVQEAIGGVTRRVVVESVETMDHIMADAVAPWRFSMALLVGLAALGVMLALAGLFALVAYSVDQRTPELAVRMAIGAAPGAILRMVLWQGGRFAAAGLAVGLILSLTTATRMSALLFQVPARDTVTFASAAILLGTTTLLASWLAARRVTRIDPLIALRGQ
jgi:putative ABC transport system permease protein